MEVRKKLTVKDIMAGCRVPKIGEDGKPVMEDGKPVTVPWNPLKGDKHAIFLVMGKARESETGNTTFGPYIRYNGAFEARRLIDGAQFMAPQIIFPPPTDGVVDNVFTAAKQGDPNAEVAFAFVIGVEQFKRGEEDKFRFTCEPIPLGDMQKIDPLADLKAAIASERPTLLPGVAPALGAPGSDAEPETAKVKGRAKETETA